MNSSMYSKSFPLTCVGLLLALSWAANGLAEDLLLVDPTAVAVSPLPEGPVATPVPLSTAIGQMAVLPDGRWRAVEASSSNPREMTLFDISADGDVTPLGLIEPDPSALFEVPADLVVSNDGDLYMLSDMLIFWNPPEIKQRLIRLDAETGATEVSIDLDSISVALAAAPNGFWALGQETLQFLDIATGTFTDTGVPLPEPRGFAAVSDASGELWIAWRGAVCTIPCFGIHRFDPATGAATPADSGLYQGFLFSDLTIDSPCRGNVSRHCMQGQVGGGFEAR